MGAAAAEHPLRGPVRVTLQVAMLVFAYNITIGILNGLDVVDFSREVLLSHLHGGTLGWMTLGILAAAMWLFADPADEAPPPTDAAVARIRGFAYLVCVAVPLYVLAFALTTGVARPVGGTATLIALIGFAAFAYGRARQVTLGVPHLLVLLGLTSSVLGGSFGVINGMAIALEWTWVPESFFGAHPGTMEIGFVIPASVGLAEWVLRRNDPPERASRSGLVQAGLLGAGFLWSLVVILLEREDLIGLGLLMGIAATVLFAVRLRGLLRHASPVARDPARHALMSGIFVAVTFVYAFIMIGAAEGDFNAIPSGQLTSFIHLLAIGGATNAILGFIVSVTRVSTPATAADDVIFWGVNVGVIGFVTALTTDVRGLIAVFVPLMGLSLVTALVVHSMALRQTAATPATPATD